jgi:hypothetical protein
MAPVSLLKPNTSPQAEVPPAVKWLADRAREHLAALDAHDAQTRRLLSSLVLQPLGTYDARTTDRRDLSARAHEATRLLLAVLE